MLCVSVFVQSINSFGCLINYFVNKCEHHRKYKMNIIDTLYENEDLSTDEGIEAICEKIKNLNVSSGNSIFRSNSMFIFTEMLLFGFPNRMG